MRTPVKYGIIGSAVVVIAIVGLLVFAGPQQILSSIFFSLSNDTEFAPGFSDRVFGEIKIGDPESAVISAVGKPLSANNVEAYTSVAFSSGPVPKFSEEGLVRSDVDYTVFSFLADGKFRSAHGQNFVSRTGGGLGSVEVTIQMGDGQNFLGINNAGIEALKKAGVTRAEIEAKYGKPVGVFESKVVRWLTYSRSPSSKNYKQCEIGLNAEGNVEEIINEIYWD